MMTQNQEEEREEPIGQFIIINPTEYGNQELPVPNCPDVRREFKLLHDRLKALEERPETIVIKPGERLGLNIKDFSGGHNVNKPTWAPEETQREPECKHDHKHKVYCEICGRDDYKTEPETAEVSSGKLSKILEKTFVMNEHATTRNVYSLQAQEAVAEVERVIDNDPQWFYRNRQGQINYLKEKLL